ncbi:MAG: ribulose phosphate epimerase [Alphaproteobacteria bacterium]|nr:ribulose phosphate epimerase [Alphaproteobacteria bacterium]
MPAPSVQSLKERCRGISAGIFAAPCGALADSTRRLADWGGQLIHFDVMDGVFVPQITAGPDFVKALGDGMVRDVHLMVECPDRHVAAFAEAGADIISVHVEAPGAARALAAIRAASAELGRPILAGLAIMPDTPLADLVPLLNPAPDLMLVLALDPRRKAPPCVGEAAARARAIREMAAPARPLVAIDGGITEQSIAEAMCASPDFAVSGSAIFRAAAPEAAFRRLAGALRRTAPDGVPA